MQSFGRSLRSGTALDHLRSPYPDWLLGFLFADRSLVDSIDDFHTFRHLSKSGELVIQIRGLGDEDEEIGGGGVRFVGTCH